ncbi:MAG TPA: hypothetical protein VD713_05990 [Sphingomonadales bacterium]|nr:hypothetical protein [Sphingomonadales bacterium]
MKRWVSAFAFVFFAYGSAAADEGGTDALVAEALSAAPDFIAKDATVHDWSHQTLKKGSNGWVCLPTSEADKARGEACPMCLDSTWHGFVVALQNGRAPKVEKTALAYMLAGDCLVSNLSPAHAATHENHAVREGAHLMILFPDPAAYETFPSDPASPGAYVMWKESPYVHLMVPLERSTE